MDIYSFGIVLWEIVTGERPLRGQTRELRCSSLYRAITLSQRTSCRIPLEDGVFPGEAQFSFSKFEETHETENLAEKLQSGTPPECPIIATAAHFTGIRQSPVECRACAARKTVYVIFNGTLRAVLCFFSRSFNNPSWVTSLQCYKPEFPGQRILRGNKLALLPASGSNRRFLQRQHARPATGTASPVHPRRGTHSVGPVTSRCSQQFHFSQPPRCHILLPGGRCPLTVGKGAHAGTGCPRSARRGWTR